MNSYKAMTAGGLARAVTPSASEKRSAPDMLDIADWKSAANTTTASSRGRRQKVRLQDLSEFTAQLSIMVRSGIDAATALGSLASQCKRPALAQVLKSVFQSVMAGTPLSESLRQHPHAFDAAFVATVAAGEASGSLADVLIQLAAMQRTELRNRRTMRALMTYPILLLVVSTSVITGLVIFVLPRFAGIFEQYEVALPIITQVLISVADELRARWWLYVPLVAVTTVGGLIWRKTAAGRETLDAMWVHLAVIRDVTRARVTGRICRLMGMMLSNGVPILESLRLTRKAVDNSLYRNLLNKLEDAVINGRNMASVLSGTEIVPQSARDMLITAEATGNVAEVSKLLGEYYEEDAEARMRQLVGLIEPALTVGMGVVVAIVVLAVMLPVFDLSSVASKNH
jgi:type II secretory pathway component PulF